MSSLPRSPGLWVPTLYFAQGLPFVIVTSVSSVALLKLGWTASEVAFFTSGLNLPWTIKPLWGPLLERWGTRRGWIVSMQAVAALALAGIAFVLPNKDWLPLTLGLFLGLGFASATHDIAADGFYMLALGSRTQAELTGVRNTFFRIAMLAGNGGLIWLAGWGEKQWSPATAWPAAFVAVAAVMFCISLYHWTILPKPATDARVTTPRAEAGEFVRIWAGFVQRPGFCRMLAFIFLYRIGESQLLKGNQAFLLDKREAGGLALATDELGYLYGTLGILALLVGGLLGGRAIARTGLRRQLWPMALAINLPHFIYIWLAITQPTSHALIGGGIAIEQFGYGYGFAAYMVYLLYVARGSHPTSHYALCSGAMALGAMLAGGIAAAALNWFGNNYLHFFIWATATGFIGLVTLWKLPLEADFGRRD
jgi:PAT family beta-lactamase induction signal transducer AmpG